MKRQTAYKNASDLKSDLEFRAELYERFYYIPKEEAFEILSRVEVGKMEPHEFMDYTYMELRPDFEKALCYFTPEVAVGLYKNVNLEEISNLLQILDSLACDFVRRPLNVEKLCECEIAYINLVF